MIRLRAMLEREGVWSEVLKLMNFHLAISIEIDELFVELDEFCT